MQEPNIEILEHLRYACIHVAVIKDIAIKCEL